MKCIPCFLLLPLLYLAGSLSAQSIYQEGSLYGIKDESGEIEVEAQYSEIIACESGFWFKSGKYWGAYDERLKVVVKPKKYVEVRAVAYEMTGDGFGEAEPILFELKPEKGGYQFANAYWLESIFPKKPVDGYELVDNGGGTPSQMIAHRGWKHGLYDLAEPYWIISPQYESIYVMDDYTAIAKIANQCYVFEAGDEQFAFIAAELKQVSGSLFLLKHHLNEAYYTLQSIDLEGQQLHKYLDGQTVEDVKPGDGGYWLLKGGKRGFAAANGRHLSIPIEFDRIDAFGKTDWWLVEKEGKKGLYGKEGEEHLEVAYDEITFKHSHKYGKHFEPARAILRKGGKIGIKQLFMPDEETWEMHHFISVEMDSIGYPLYPSYWIPVKKNGKWGLLDKQGQEILASEHQMLFADSKVLRLKQDEKWGAMKVLKGEDESYSIGEQLLDFDYDSLFYQKGAAKYMVMNKGGKQGVLSLEEGLYSVPLEYDWLLFANDSTLRAKKGTQVGDLDLKTSKFKAGKSFSSMFSLKWKTEIGKTVFRTNLMLVNGNIVIGSNGNARNQADKKDGVYIIDPASGKVELLIRPEEEGKIDVNGQAASDEYIFFGNENGNAYCYTFDGTKVWEQPLEGEVENSPALADFNQDGKLDAVFATDAGKVYALNGLNGEVLWSYATEGYAYFMASPICYDVSGDGVADVLIGNGGRGVFRAFDGVTGKVLWERQSSGVHSPASIVKDEKGVASIAYSPSYGGVFFLGMDGEVKYSFDSEIGSFAKPLFLPNGRVATASSWWDGKSDEMALYETQNEKHWEYHSSWKRFALQKEGKVNKQKTHSVSSTGIVADIMGDGKLEVIWVSEAADAWIFSEEGELIQQLYLPAGVEAPLWIGDADADGRLELLVAGLDGYLYCYGVPKSGKVAHGQFMEANDNNGIITFPKAQLPEN